MRSENEITPLISVMMGVYNCASTVEESVQSILNQTISDWELIICEDGSTDNTLEIVKRLQHQNPDRIILLENGQNCGLNYTLNRCLSAAPGKYIARMDGDDISLPDRLEKQAAFLNEHPDIAIVGALKDAFDESGIWGRHTYPQNPTKADFLRTTVFGHPGTMVRREAYLSVGGYSEGKWLMRVEDFHLWMKMYAAGYIGANLQEVLYQYRDDRNGYTKRKFRYRLNAVYVKKLAVKELKLPANQYLRSLRPLLVGLLPAGLYRLLHHLKLSH